MFTFISIMAVGVLIGYPLRHKSQVRKITPLIHIVVCCYFSYSVSLLVLTD